MSKVPLKKLYELAIEYVQKGQEVGTRIEGEEIILDYLRFVQMNVEK